MKIGGGASGSGDIEAVVAGAGLTGGGTSGSATLDVGAGANITVNANDVALATNVQVAGTLGSTGVFTTTTTSNLRDVRLLTGLARNSSSSPAALASGTTNNLTISGLSGLNRVRLTPGAGGSSLGGIIPVGVNGSELMVHNVGSASLTLLHEEAGSTAANRFVLEGGASRVIGANGCVLLNYDTVSARWFVVG